MPIINQQMSEPFAEMGCVIMASGLGRRFGGNKLLADFGGEPMICRALAATEGLFARRVVVTRSEAVAQLCRARGVEAVCHDLPDRSDTVRLGLEAVGAVPGGCLFLPGDQPLLRRETVAALARCAAENGGFIWRTASGGEPGSPVLFPAWAFEALRTLPQGQGGRAVVRRYPERVRLMEVDDPDELRDADTPEALAELLAK